MFERENTSSHPECCNQHFGDGNCLDVLRTLQIITGTPNSKSAIPPAIGPIIEPIVIAQVVITVNITIPSVIVLISNIIYTFIIFLINYTLLFT